MAYLAPAPPSLDELDQKEKKTKSVGTIEGTYDSIESALKNPVVANQLSITFKYSDYLKSLNEILDVVRNIRNVSSEEAEYILPLKKALHEYSMGLYDKLFSQTQLAEIQRVHQNILNDVNQKHQAECEALQTRISILEEQNSNFRKLVSMGDSAFLLDDSCSTVHLKIYSKIEEELKFCEDLIKKSSHFRIHVKTYSYANHIEDFLNLLISSIKYRFGREGWVLEVKKEKANAFDFYLVPKKDALVAMGLTEDLSVGALKPKKEFILLRFYRWFRGLW